MAKKCIKLCLSGSSYKIFRSVMKTCGFEHEDIFLRYCIANTAKSKAGKKYKPLLLKEIRLAKERRKGPRK